MQIHEMSALQMADYVRAGELSPVEIVEHVEHRAQAMDERLGIFVTRTTDIALARARVLEQAVSDADEPAALPPLVGVPCPIKDLTAVAGVPLTLGSAVFADNVADVDDGVVTLLHRAGTVMTGKTNTPEFGLPCYTEPDVAPAARSPWDPTRTAGGSSGGAAVAVATGVAPVAHGSDGGGSIRIPASACGVVGLKPTRGRISPGPNGVDVSGLAVTGPLGRTVADVAALLDVMSTPWPGDVAALPRPRTSFLDATRRRVPRQRVGLLTEPVISAQASVHPACRLAAEQVAQTLENLGHHVEPVQAPFPAEQWEAFSAVWGCLAASLPVPAEREADLRALTRWLRQQGRAVRGVDYVVAVAAMQQLARQVARSWSHLDVVVSPTLADLPVAVGALRDDADPAADFAAQTRFTPWTSVWNLTGRPAISLPIAWHREGSSCLPVGVMLGARFAEEELLLSLSAELELVHPWAQRYREI